MRKFEPQKPEKEVISLRLDTQTLYEINELAVMIDISRNELINQCIEFALKNLDEDLVRRRDYRSSGRGGVSNRPLKTGFEDSTDDIGK